MYTSLRHIVSVLASCLLISAATAQSGRSYTPPVLDYLGSQLLSDTVVHDSIARGILVDGRDLEYFFYTPMYYHKEHKKEKAYTAFRRLLEVFPSAFYNPKYQAAIVESYGQTHHIDDIADELWSEIALNYDNPTFVQLPNLFFAELNRQKQYEQLLRQEETSNMILQANSPKDETKLSMDYRQETLLLSRHDRLEGESFFVAKKKDNIWLPFTKEPFITVIENTETAASIDASGRHVLFTQCMSRAWEPMGGGGCDLWFTSAVSDSTWSPAQKYRAGINTPQFEGLATFSTDGRVLYFTSDRPGGFGGRDIWYSEWNGKNWLEPQNAGSIINTPADEFSPYISEDGQALFYSKFEKGNSELYFYHNDSTASHKLPEPYNTVGDEISCQVNSRDRTLIVATNGHTNDKNFDLMIYPLEDKYLPDSTRTISGQMLTMSTLTPYYAEYSPELGFNTLEDPFKVTNVGNGWYFWDIVNTPPFKKIDVRNLVSLEQKMVILPIKSEYLSDRLIWNHLFL